LTVLFNLAFVAFKSFAVVSDFDIAHAAITCHVVHVFSFKFQRPQITVVTSHPCYDTVTLNPNNETELHGIAVVLLCDKLTGSLLTVLSQSFRRSLISFARGRQHCTHLHIHRADCVSQCCYFPPVTNLTYHNDLQHDLDGVKVNHHHTISFKSYQTLRDPPHTHTHTHNHMQTAD